MSRKASTPLIVTELVPSFDSGLNFKANCNLDPVPVNVSVSVSSVITYVREILSNLILILLARTTSLSIFIAARAATPPTAKPPDMVIIGDLRYPEPFDVNINLLTRPLAMYALAVAPVPNPPSIVTTGFEIYPEPDSTNVILSTVNPTWSFQCFHGYVASSVDSVSIVPCWLMRTLTGVTVKSELITGVKSKSVTELWELSNLV